MGSDVVQLEQVTSHFEDLRLGGDAQELALRSYRFTRSHDGLSVRRTARCEGVLQLLKLHHRGRILLCCRRALIQSIGVSVAGRCRTAGNRIRLLY